VTRSPRRTEIKKGAAAMPENNSDNGSNSSKASSTVVDLSSLNENKFEGMTRAERTLQESLVVTQLVQMEKGLKQLDETITGLGTRVENEAADRQDVQTFIDANSFATSYKGQLGEIREFLSYDRQQLEHEKTQMPKTFAEGIELLDRHLTRIEQAFEKNKKALDECLTMLVDVEVKLPLTLLRDKVDELEKTLLPEKITQLIREDVTAKARQQVLMAGEEHYQKELLKASNRESTKENLEWARAEHNLSKHPQFQEELERFVDNHMRSSEMLNYIELEIKQITDKQITDEQKKDYLTEKVWTKAWDWLSKEWDNLPPQRIVQTQDVLSTPSPTTTTNITVVNDISNYTVQPKEERKGLLKLLERTKLLEIYEELKADVLKITKSPERPSQHVLTPQPIDTTLSDSFPKVNPEDERKALTSVTPLQKAALLTAKANEQRNKLMKKIEGKSEQQIDKVLRKTGRKFEECLYDETTKPKGKEIGKTADGVIYTESGPALKNPTYIKWTKNASQKNSKDIEQNVKRVSKKSL
jgi:hypothetical protein